MNKRSRAMVFSFLSTLLTLAAAARVGASHGQAAELAIILAGLALTLVVGAIINSPDKDVSPYKREDKEK